MLLEILFTFDIYFLRSKNLPLAPDQTMVHRKIESRIVYTEQRRKRKNPRIMTATYLGRERSSGSEGTIFVSLHTKLHAEQAVIP